MQALTGLTCHEPATRPVPTNTPPQRPTLQLQASRAPATDHRMKRTRLTRTRTAAAAITRGC